MRPRSSLGSRPLRVTVDAATSISVWQPCPVVPPLGREHPTSRNSAGRRTSVQVRVDNGGLRPAASLTRSEKVVGSIPTGGSNKTPGQRLCAADASLVRPLGSGAFSHLFSHLDPRPTTAACWRWCDAGRAAVPAGGRHWTRVAERPGHRYGESERHRVRGDEPVQLPSRSSEGQEKPPLPGASARQSEGDGGLAVA